jgi:hypothetical protein
VRRTDRRDERDQLVRSSDIRHVLEDLSARPLGASFGCHHRQDGAEGIGFLIAVAGKRKQTVYAVGKFPLSPRPPKGNSSTFAYNGVRALVINEELKIGEVVIEARPIKLAYRIVVHPFHSGPGIALCEPVIE